MTTKHKPQQVSGHNRCKVREQILTSAHRSRLVNVASHSDFQTSNPLWSPGGAAEWHLSLSNRIRLQRGEWDFPTIVTHISRPHTSVGNTHTHTHSLTHAVYVQQHINEFRRHTAEELTQKGSGWKEAACLTQILQLFIQNNTKRCILWALKLTYQ